MKNTVVMKIMGGFGNQLFCYACGYAVARESNRNLVIDTSQQDNDSFRKTDLMKLNIQYQRRITFKKKDNLMGRLIINRCKLVKEIGFFPVVIKEKKPYLYQDNVFSNKECSIYMDGYWQSEKYFKKYRKEIIKLFVFQGETSKYYEETVRKIRNCNKSVAIHIRRGDYVSIGCNMDIRFYEEAIQNMISNLGNDVTFFLFSDDIEFAKEFSSKYINMNVINNPNKENSTIEDFMLMKECMHQIISNSSFSWWAAWLNENEEKVVICPEIDEWTGDFYPENWMKFKSNYA